MQSFFISIIFDYDLFTYWALLDNSENEYKYLIQIAYWLNSNQDCILRLLIQTIQYKIKRQCFLLRYITFLYIQE